MKVRDRGELQEQSPWEVSRRRGAMFKRTWLLLVAQREGTVIVTGWRAKHGSRWKVGGGLGDGKMDVFPSSVMFSRGRYWNVCSRESQGRNWASAMQSGKNAPRHIAALCRARCTVPRKQGCLTALLQTGRWGDTRGAPQERQWWDLGLVTKCQQALRWWTKEQSFPVCGRQDAVPRKCVCHIQIKHRPRYPGGFGERKRGCVVMEKNLGRDPSSSALSLPNWFVIFEQKTNKQKALWTSDRSAL